MPLQLCGEKQTQYSLFYASVLAKLAAAALQEAMDLLRTLSWTSI
jgi:hypothetical protein